MRILILGARGRLGTACGKALADVGNVVGAGRDQVDVTDVNRLHRAFDLHRPSVVINAAGYTDVDRAEAEPDRAWAVNAKAPAQIAAACRNHGGLLFHLSTDFVFDGRKASPYTEEDAPSPLGAYAASKLAGEQAVLGAECAAIVLRTAWLYGEPGGDFVDKVLVAALAKPLLQGVTDQRGSPTWSGRIATVIRCLLLGDDGSGRDQSGPPIAARTAIGTDAAMERLRAHAGLYHACAYGAVSRHEWARHIVAAAARTEGVTLQAAPDRIEPVPSSAWPSAAKRPANAVLDCGKLERTFAIRIPDWRDDLIPYVQRRAKALAASHRADTGTGATC
jgi:dTDP-4-dehydrorhamnose reductase